MHMCLHDKSSSNSLFSSCTAVRFEVSCSAEFVENNQVLEIRCVTAEDSQTITEVQYSLNGGDRQPGTAYGSQA